MAYKFQLGDAVLSGSLTSKGDSEEIKVIDDDQTNFVRVGQSGNQGLIRVYEGGSLKSKITSGLLSGSKLSAVSEILTQGTLNVSGAATFADTFSLSGKLSSSAAASLVGALDTVGAIASSGSVTAGSSFIIGGSNVNETELGFIDGASAGVGTANKALVLDASADVASGLRSVTGSGDLKIANVHATAGIYAAAAVEAGTSFVIGNADLNETDMEKLDGITNGTVAASKAVVVDANKDATGFRSLTGSGDLKIANVHATAGIWAAAAVEAGTSFVIGSADLNEADMEKLDGITNGTVAASKAVVVDANKDASGFRDVTLRGLSGSGDLTMVGNTVIVGTLSVTGATDTAMVAGDDLFFRDADGTMRRDSFSDVMEIAAGTVTTTGIENSSGVLSVAIHSLNAETIATGDKIAFSDAGDNGLHSETVDDLFAKGLPLLTDTAMAVANDYIVFLDGGADGDGKKESWADLMSATAGSGVTATNGVLSVDTAGGDRITVNAGIGDANGVLAAGLNFGTATLTAARTWSLPHTASMTIGDIVIVKANAGLEANNLTIQRNSGCVDLIDGTEESVKLMSSFGALSLVYAAAGQWRIY